MKGYQTARMWVAVTVGLLAAVSPAQAQAPTGSYLPPDFLSEYELAKAVEAVEAYVYAKPPSSTAIKMYDYAEQRFVTLEFLKIHTDRKCLVNLGQNRIAICVDFKSEDGRVYIVWFALEREVEEREVFLAGEDEPYLRPPRHDFFVKETAIQSVDGQDRYTWDQQPDGTWKLRPARRAADSTTSG